MSESHLVRSILLAYGTSPTIRLFRQNTGVGVGLKHSGVISFGLCKGSSDIIGIKSPEGRFIALECKMKPRKATPEQVQFLLMVDRMGGIAACVYSLEDCFAVLGRPTK